MPIALKPEPSLNLTPTLYFELRFTATLYFELGFPIFIINGYDRKANGCSPWISCNNITVPRNTSMKFITTYHKSFTTT